MFKLVRYFSITSLITLSVASVVSAVIYKELAIKDLIKFGEKENIIVTQVFGNLIWSKYESFLTSTSSLNDEQIKNHSETQRLYNDIQLQTRGLSVVKIKIFDLKGRTIFSTELSNIGQDYSKKPGFISARNHQVATKLDHRDTFNSLNGAIKNRKLLSSYIPLKAIKEAKYDQVGEIKGVFELYSDVTPLVEKVHYTQQTIILLSAGIWGFIYILLLLIVKHAEKIMKNQHQIQQQTQIALQHSEQKALQQAVQLENALQELHKSQAQKLHTDKMASLGLLVAGVAHELNNPISFIFGNLKYLSEYTQEILQIISSYQQHYPHPPQVLLTQIKNADLEYIMQDLTKIIKSMEIGSERIYNIVLALRNFSRFDEAEFKPVDIHEGIDNTLLILQHRLKATKNRPEIQVIKNYGNLPMVECYAGQLNQVFMNIINNAIDAIEEQNQKYSYQEILQNPNCITITTDVTIENQVKIIIADNGNGISESIINHIFDPFYTTKPVGKGTGLGLYISYQIITEKHGGSLQCFPAEPKGTQFFIQIPLQYNVQRL